MRWQPATADIAAAHGDICTVDDGEQQPTVHGQYNDSPPAHGGMHFEHCPFCFTHAGSFALPPSDTALIPLLATPVVAQAADKTLPTITVEGTRSVAEKNQLPVTTESVTAAQAAETINAMNVEDTLKYLPNVLVRKRYIGDTNGRPAPPASTPVPAA